MQLHEVQRARRRARVLPSAAAILAVLLAAPQWSGVRAQTADRPGYRGDARNPFDLTAPILKRFSDSEAKVGFQNAEGNAPAPKMKLKGMVMLQNGNKAALLEVQGVGTHVVREGDTIGINVASPNAVIRVKRIDRMQIEVEVGSMRQVILVR
ncbi:hypothetical protein [Thiocystis violascens]|uniref:Uncharacterized protein n=1 Tax=Thiocystis violascens (strain ATCC 17096 / DSM 198 / 6111) TaxID=765911 RepID=I3Y5I6_THIV6|nr:hypothetical protein [Thiocystis violascens]AFL72254.1 hypothetical protein Thivi_0182 [Thiocystis violascens DSM 198]